MITMLFAVELAASPLPSTGSPFVIDRMRADRVAPPAKRRRRIARVRPKTVSASGAPKPVPITTIQFPLDTPPPSVIARTRPFLGRIADQETLTALAEAMSAAYDDTPIALHTIAIEGDDIAGGVVKVRVAQGYVERVDISGAQDAAVAARVRRLAAPMLVERPLRRATMARVLALLNTIPGATVDAGMIAGDAPGAVVLDVKVAARRWALAVSADNRAPALLGHEEAQATLAIHNLLRPGDDTSIGLSTAPEPARFNYVTVAHETPIGADGLTASANIGLLHTRAGAERLPGHAFNWAVGLSYPLRLATGSSLNAALSFDGLNSDNAVLAQWIVTERSRAVRATLSYDRSNDQRGLSASVVLSRGLNIFGACGSPLSGRSTFTKVNATLHYERLLGPRVVARLATAAQYTGAPLPTAETFALGGADYGRAFDTGIITGDRGVAASAELAWAPGWTALPLLTELYGFADGARVRLLRRDFVPASSDGLASLGVGARGKLGRASLDLSVAQPLARPRAIGGGTRLSMAVSVAFGG